MAVALSVLACGGDGAEEAGPAGAVDLPTFCVEAATALCEWSERCEGLPCTSGSSDVTRVVTRCAKASAAVAGGRVAYDPEVAGHCLAALREVSCLAVDPADALFPGPAGASGACAGLLEGRVRLGGECYPDRAWMTDECAEGYCAAESSSSCPGACEPFVAPGEPCDPYEPWSCGPDARCHSCGADDAGCEEVCVARVAEGGACADTDACAAGLVCSAGTCLRGVGLDAPCAVNACVGALTCLDGVCRDSVPAGAPCLDDRACPEGQRCLTGEDGAKICHAPWAEGEACLVAEDACAVALACRTPRIDVLVGTCGAPDLVGESCLRGHCEAHAECASGTCVALAAGGEPCGAGLPECASGLACLSDGACHPPGQVGEPCAPGAPATCAAGLWCDRGTASCKAPGAGGDPCDGAQPLASCQIGGFCPCLRGNCATGTPDPGEVCIPLRDLGAPCVQGWECASSVCESGACALSSPWECALPLQ